MKFIAVVEGDGEVEAVPVLLRRISSEIAPLHPPEVLKPIRVRRQRVLRDGELERYLQLAAGRVGPDGVALVLLDADEDCPAEVAAEVLRRANAVRPDVRIEAVVAKCEYENWLIAGVEAIAGTRGLQEGLGAPPDPESIRGAKEWLSRRMERSYRPTADQAAWSAGFDMHLARRRSRSFDKMWRAVQALLH